MMNIRSIIRNILLESEEAGQIRLKVIAEPHGAAYLFVDDKTDEILEISHPPYKVSISQGRNTKKELEAIGIREGLELETFGLILPTNITSQLEKKADTLWRQKERKYFNKTDFVQKPGVTGYADGFWATEQLPITLNLSKSDYLWILLANKMLKEMWQKDVLYRIGVIESYEHLKKTIDDMHRSGDLNDEDGDDYEDV